MTALAKTENAEVKAMAHAAHTFSRLSVQSFRLADEQPHRAMEYLSDARRLRAAARTYLAWARREQAWSRAQAMAAMEAETA